MNFKFLTGINFARVLSLATLLIGLRDASCLLGVKYPEGNPIEMLGVVSFIFLAIFTVARLFASVGLWINASWGTALIIGATVIECLMLVFGRYNPDFSWPGIIARLGVLAGLLLLLGLRNYYSREFVHD